MRCPDKKLAVLRSFEVPKNVSQVQQLVGFFSFFSILIRNSKALMEPLIKLIRKDTPYQWGETQDYCFNELKRRLEKAMITGFLKLSDGSLLQEIVVFVDWCKISSSAGAVVFVKEYDQQTLTVAYFWSRLLSDTFKDKPPFINELASVCLFLNSCSYLIGMRMTTIWVDSLVCNSILKSFSVYQVYYFFF